MNLIKISNFIYIARGGVVDVTFLPLYMCANNHCAAFLLTAERAVVQVHNDRLIDFFWI